ncbi:MAG: carboxymuconolactone decarboxylase family protein [Nitrospinota bacterium]|jgi:AhpD family alkylhydroperoxidase|nr:alkylhydroperoxidase [Nitrospinota bacterium]MDP6367088.1 carboxymuconolactone decarboxylase family protein [Nitrospinota bacterium]
MPRISLIESDMAEASAKRIMDNLQKQFGVVIDPVKALAHKPDLLRALLSLTTVADGPGDIDPGFKEVLNIRASVLNGCGYCTGMHSQMAGMHKVRAEKIEGAKEGSASGVFDEREKAALALCEESTQGVKVSDATFERARSHYSEAEVVELLGVIGVINMWNRLIVSLGF